MSSLLDILQRKDGAVEPVDGPEVASDEATRPMELRLAVDNGPEERQQDGAAEAGPEAGTDFATAAPHSAPPAFDPLASIAAPSGDATRVLLARQVKQRSRRSTLWLGAGLAVIVIGAGLATWLLQTTDDGAAGGDSLFAAPTAAPASPASSGTVERPAPARPKPAAAAPTPPANRARPADAAADKDDAWYDTPATADAPADGLATGAEAIRITRGSDPSPLFAKLSAAWTALQAGDYARAETLYREVRAADAGNVDALLGLGALAARGDRSDEARELYQAVLQLEPRNATANSALSTLPAGGAGPLDESALKNLLREQPGAASLHFALGLNYVTAGRWQDAQTAFFDAVRLEPVNADYAYNLAVSLDQLGQSAPAAAYYQRALELAGASALFDTGAATERLAALRSAAP